jgi:AraC-like DNA-binding protein
MNHLTEERIEKLHELCRFRSTLEVFALDRWRKLADRAAAENPLRESLEKLRQYAVKKDYPAFHEMDNHFHRTLIDSANLPVLLASWERVVEELNEWVSNVQETCWPHLMSLHREHVLLLEAWLSDDEWVAHEATHQHLEAGWYRMLSVQKQFADRIDPVGRVTAYIRAHYGSQLTVEWLAQNVCFVSTSQLRRLFKQQVGVAPHQFLKEVRLTRAATLLHKESQPVATVAAHVGYQNTSHFIRDFRAEYRVTPLAYRRSGP